jgi:hypothetical protein
MKFELNDSLTEQAMVKSGRLGLAVMAILACQISVVQAAQLDESLWKDNTVTAARSVTNSHSNDGYTRSLKLDSQAMRAKLAAANSSIQLAARQTQPLSIELPLPNGDSVSLELTETQLLPSALANKYPSIRTYQVASPTGEILSGRVDMTVQGFHAMLLTKDGETLFIDPDKSLGEDYYLSYRKADQHSDEPFQCSTPEAHDHEAFSPLHSRANLAARSVSGLTEYRIAIAATGEYTQKQGGTVAASLSAIATTLNRVNQIYETSLGIRLTLIEGNDQLIYTNANSDPYSNFDIEAMLSENQKNIDSVIGNDNYDIGHVFGSYGGGLAYIGSTCNSSIKAMAASGINNPSHDSFDVDFVAHEIGHQFGATHTFNSNLGVCTSGARTAKTAFEPGSGSSIMSYAGGCGTDDLQLNADAMFHSGSIQQITQNISIGTASHCGTVQAVNNSRPFVSAGSNYTIPANTPFELTGTASDLENDSLLYSWEQLDVGSSANLGEDTGDNPLFRLKPPTTSNTRSFPARATSLGYQNGNGETLPQTNRTLNFQLAVYDGQHDPSLDQIQLKVINTGAGFKLSDSAQSYARDSSISINWTVADTDIAPINCSAVDVQLSSNDGYLFDTTLASNIPNSGSAIIKLPADIPLTAFGRFKLSCSNNVFYSISSKAFTIGQNVSTGNTTPRTDDATSVDEISNSGGGGSSSFWLISMISLLFLFRNKSLS